MRCSALDTRPLSINRIRHGLQWNMWPKAFSRSVWERRARASSSSMECRSRGRPPSTNVSLRVCFFFVCPVYFGSVWEGEALEILKLDDSCISDPKSEISDWTVRGFRVDRQSNRRFRISDLRCRIRPISKFPYPCGSFPEFDTYLKPE